VLIIYPPPPLLYIHRPPWLLPPRHSEHESAGDRDGSCGSITTLPVATSGALMSAVPQKLT